MGCNAVLRSDTAYRELHARSSPSHSRGQMGRGSPVLLNRAPQPLHPSQGYHRIWGRVRERNAKGSDGNFGPSLTVPRLFTLDLRAIVNLLGAFSSPLTSVSDRNRGFSGRER